MIDITREEIWENKTVEIERKDNRVNSFIKKHKIITMLLISLGILMTVNIILIYNFLNILVNM